MTSDRMARDYNIIIDLDAVESLPKSGRRREEVIAYLRWLSGAARIAGDIRFQDELSQRTYEVSLVAGFPSLGGLTHPSEASGLLTSDLPNEEA